MPKYIYPFLLGLFVFSGIINAQYKTESVLANGDIFKFAVSQSGVYTMDYAFIQSIEDIDVDQINPLEIQLYTNPGGLIPQLISSKRVDDLNPIRCIITGESDGSFDPGDKIIFYAEGADRFNLSANDYDFEKNHYDTRNYVYLKTNVTNPTRFTSQEQFFEPDTWSQSKESVARHEIDRINLLAEFGGTQGSGKQWFGESFTNNFLQDFSSSFSFPNLVTGAEAELHASLSSRSSAFSQFEINIGDSTFTSTHGISNLGNIESIYAKTVNVSTTFILNEKDPTVAIEYLPTTNDSEGWLDYIQLTARERLIYDNQPIFISDRKSVSEESFGFEIGASQNLTVWDISDITDLKELETNFRSEKVSFAFRPDNQLRAFIAFDPASVKNSPQFISKVTNQNLHGIQEVDFVIIYHPEFEASAKRLATHRNATDGLQIQVVSIFKVYEEFGGGRKEATALRDFAKMLYERDSDFKYMLLFGDASYDYRGLNQNIAYQNFVPTYETDESLHPVEAFPSDDFFALLSDNEGDISLDGALDIAVGRIPCKSAEEAEGVVDKIIHYDLSPDCLGPWRLNTGYSADDVDKASDGVHVQQSDEIARETFQAHPEFIQKKVYWDAFTQVSTPGGQRYPDANATLAENIEKGQLVLGYLGHGGPRGWSQERVLQINDLNGYRNFNKLPVIITATCSFTGFDEPNFVSAGEVAILNPRGGAIALFTTVRAVYSSSNKRLTQEVYEEIFARQDGKRQRIGDIIVKAKNANSADTTSSNSRKFLLMGDPTMILATPKNRIVLSSVNGESINAQTLDTLGALDRVRLSGIIEDYEGIPLTGFDGTLSLTIFDKPAPRKTLNNDGFGSPFNFTMMKNILFKGSATVKNGEFTIDAIIPKDINFEFGKGHVSMYASDGISEDAGGYYDQFIIGGISEEEITDNEGPEIDIYMDNRSFQFGDMTRTNPLLIVDLRDESGINLSSTSIGHDITASLEEKNNNSIILNDFYTPTIDVFGEGTVEYQLDELEPGLHSIHIKAWDILNNSSEAFTEFLVVENLEGFIENVLNYPNPVISDTRFSFEHDLANSDLDIAISIYSLSGILVKTINENNFSSGNSVDDIYWNGKDDNENKLARGIYIYKINITSEQLNLNRESDFHKLVILN